MIARHSDAGFRHRLRVRLGSVTGPRGRLLRCQSRRPGVGEYWSVKLENGEWRWPRDLIVDGRGDELAPDPCGQCGLPFVRVRASGAILCEPCDTAQFGGPTRIDQPSARHDWNARRRWRRG